MNKWKCPYCGENATISDRDTVVKDTTFPIDTSTGRQMIRSVFIACPNEDCNKFTLNVSLGDYYVSNGKCYFEDEGEVERIDIKPSSFARQYPAYIPSAIIRDYEEACSIKVLSPKASATLSRRCLQGIIRDYWSVSDKNLAKEIEAIKDKVDPTVYDAIDAVRQIGNIGAHMEKDINLIIDVEKNEAGKLIELIEMLIEEWYINKHEREQRLKDITKINSDKQERRNVEVKKEN